VVTTPLGTSLFSIQIHLGADFLEMCDQKKWKQIAQRYTEAFSKNLRGKNMAFEKHRAGW